MFLLSCVIFFFRAFTLFFFFFFFNDTATTEIYTLSLHDALPISADVGNRHCIRVREGGQVLQTTELDRGCFACILGGADRETLFIVATEWHGPEHMAEGEHTGQVLTIDAAAAGVGWP